jgi:hypothetical protein
VRKAVFAGKYEFPVISSCNEIPEDLIPFSRARKNSEPAKLSEGQTVLASKKRR